MNAVSLAVGVAVGSLITFYLTKREIRRMWRSLERSELVTVLREVLVLSRDVLKSNEARTFFKRLSEVLEGLVGKKKLEEELIVLPES